ncbi:MAG: GAF domain-containing protein [Chrysiogenetes bacterium]|nr:GAF domain-containing protein [Chrysiogenetes bacterium]
MDKVEDLGALRAQLEELSQRVQIVEAENHELRDRCSLSEEEHFRFVNLYVASQRLSNTLDVEEIMEIVQEIVVNLVGSEQFGMFFLADEDTEELPLELVAEVTQGEQQMARPTPTHPKIQEVLRSGKLWVSDDPALSPAAVVPLKIEEELLGVVVVYGLLPQKPAFTETDVSLFELLTTHVARAFYAALMHERSGVMGSLAADLRARLAVDALRAV